MVVDMNYMDKLSRISGLGHPLLKLKFKMTYYIKCIFRGKFGLIFKSIKSYIKRKTKKKGVQL